MAKWQLAYIAACMSVIVGCLCYLLSDFGSWPTLMYEPTTANWLVATTPPTRTAMVYPGLLLWGVTGAVTGAAGTLLLGSFARCSPHDKTLRLVGAWALTAFGFSCAYFFWGLWPF